MNRSLVGSAVLGCLGGVVNVVLTLALLTRVNSPLFRPGEQTSLNSVFVGSIFDTPHIWVGVFTLGFVPVFVTAATRLVAPSVGFVSLLGGVASTVLASPVPEGMTGPTGLVIDGPVYASSYAKSWYAWLAVLLVAGVAEFVLRYEYGVGDDRLRHLPDFPLSRSRFWLIVCSAGFVVGLGVGLLDLPSYVQTDISTVLVVLVPTGVATAATLAALLSRGLVAPLALYAFVAPAIVADAVFPSYPSPEGSHPELSFLYLSVAVSVLALLELVIRSRDSDRDGGIVAG
ncbi:hypothetical protein [Natrinema salaciae]|uniref:Uncharacterized protein n=1 Tax=Natrinema salaciae TaxID=1186196 RepID=A0A1H9IEB2_9EURY|nr:hypothetical protein [Natrinema salaciae]SEQ72887.1 hypothetical protein SAMN04489841_2204 [Natrinema salaciae]